MDRVTCAQNGKDATNICIPQCREAFFRLMSSGGTLYFEGCKWTDAEVKQLVAALQYAHAEGATSQAEQLNLCLLYTSPSPRDRTRSRMPSSA